MSKIINIFIIILNLNAFAAEVENSEYTSLVKQSVNADIVLKDFIIPNGSLILDVGCGNGEVTHKIFSATGASKIVGIDPDKNKIEDARINYAENPKLDFREESIENFSERETYDVSTCFSTLHWLSEENKKIAFQKVSESLKPRGIFIATFMIEKNKIRLNKAVQEVITREKWQKNFMEYVDPIHVEDPHFIKVHLELFAFQIQNFEYDETTRDFKSNEEFHTWINKWSTYKKYFEEQNQHDEFWWDVIRLYRKLTNQTTGDVLNWTEYNLRLYAIKL